MQSLLTILVSLFFVVITSSAFGATIQDHREWLLDTVNPSVITGCAPVVPGASLTLTGFDCRAYVRDQFKWKGVDQSAQPVGPLSGGDGTYWLGIRDVNFGTCPAGWTCQDRTHYMFILSATQPAEPISGLVFMKVTVAGAVITALEHVADRILSNTLTLAENTVVNESANWTFLTGGLVDCGAFTFLFNGDIVVLPTQQIFTNCDAGEVEFGNVARIYPDYWGVVVDDDTVDNQPAIQAAVDALPETPQEEGGTILLNRSEYWVATQIDWKPFVNLQGVNQKSSKIRCKGAITCVSFVGAAAFDDFKVIMRDVSFKGEDVPAAAPAIVRIQDVQAVEFRNVNVRGSSIDCYNISGDSVNIRIIGGSTEQCGSSNINASLTQFVLMGHAATATVDAFPDTYLLQFEGARSVIIGNRFEGTGNAEHCFRMVVSVAYTLIAGNRFETCLNTSVNTTAGGSVQGVTFQNNNFGNAGAAVRIDLSAAAVCDGLVIDGNRFDVDVGSTIFSPGPCVAYRVVNNTTEITTPTWVLGVEAASTKHNINFGTTTAELGIINNAILPLKTASTTACATSISAADGSLLELTSCAAPTALLTIVNGFKGQIIVLTGFPNANFTIADQPDIALAAATFNPDDADDSLTLIHVGSNNWREIGRNLN